MRMTIFAAQEMYKCIFGEDVVEAGHIHLLLCEDIRSLSYLFLHLSQ